MVNIPSDKISSISYNCLKLGDFVRVGFIVFADKLSI